MTRDDIERELGRASAMVRAAERSLTRRQAVAVDPLDRLVARACAASQRLPAQEARGLLPAMEALIGDLNRLDAALRDQARALAGDANANAVAKGSGGVRAPG